MTIIKYMPDKKVKDFRNKKGGCYEAECVRCKRTFYPKRNTAKYCTSYCNIESFRDRQKEKLKQEKSVENISSLLKVAMGKKLPIK